MFSDPGRPSPSPAGRGGVHVCEGHQDGEKKATRQLRDGGAMGEPLSLPGRSSWMSASTGLLAKCREVARLAHACASVLPHLRNELSDEQRVEEGEPPQVASATHVRGTAHIY